MNKSIIALAVAGALSVPMVAQADATLYGSLRIKAQATDGTNENLNVTDNASRIGIKGSSELFDGNSAFFQYEQFASTDTGALGAGRLANLGIKGDFGTAVFGRIWTPYYGFTGSVTDIADNATSAATTYVIGLHRASDVIGYVSPSMNGLTVAAAIVAGNAADVGNNENIDISHVAAKYTVDGMTAAVSYLGDEINNEAVTSFALSYGMDNIYVAARYEDRDAGFLGGAESNAWGVAGSYAMGNTKLIANYQDDDAANGKAGSVEVQQKLGAQARAFAAYMDRADADGGAGIEVGYRVDF